MVADWQDLMTRWNRDLLRCPRVAERLPDRVVRRGWLGHPPATGRQIRQAELRLGTSLPPSYRRFLQVTDGWRTLGGEVGPLWPASEVDWLRARHPEVIDGWLEGMRSYGAPLASLPSVPDEQYFVYGPAQLPESIRPEYLSTMLEVSELGHDGGALLLNPQVATEEGDWEAWLLGPSLPGAARYRSFWDLMENELELFVC